MASKFEKWSAPVLLFIHGLPTWAFPLFTATLLLTGLFVTNGLVGGILLILLGIVLGWLVALSWRLLAPTARVIRILMLLVTFLYAAGRISGRY